VISSKQIRCFDNEPFRVSIFLLMLTLALLLAPLQSYKTETKDSSSTSTSKSQEITTESRSDITTSALIPLVSAVLGGLAGAGISICYSRRQARKEYRSLILSFCSEMVSIFRRCVMYYKQARTREVSYSALFSFTDASALSKFASVCEKPEVVAAIIELKSMYFQTQRHVEEASRFAIEGGRASDPQEKQDLMGKASHAQGTALAFFLSSYDRIVKETERIVEAALHVAPGDVANDLSSRFSEAKGKKKKLDGKHNNSMQWAQ